MQEKNLKITNKLGLHARPAAMFVKAASKYKSNIKILKNEQEVDGKSIMGLLTLSASEGSEIKIIVDGPDENVAVEELARIVESKFYEE